MAIIKHISGKNADLSSPIKYLTMKHDEKNGKPLKDENGEFMMRENILLNGMNISSPEEFQIECLELNKNIGKNAKRSDVKTHHFILSFDPRDVSDHGLTMEKAQRLGMEYAHEFLDGHQALICTHPDGDNGSGNIHVHIVVNSLKKFDTDEKDWMEKKGERTAGCKIRTSKAFMNASKDFVMEMCKREGLYQEDLLKPAQEKVTDREYRTQQRGQEKLDKKNKEIEEAGLQPKKKDFYTRNRNIRTAIRKVSYKAKTVEEFKELMMKDHGIEVTESRGKWGYKMEGENRPIRARRLGADFEKEAVISAINSVREMIDIDGNEKAQGSRGYRKALELENIQRQAKTISYLNEHGIADLNELTARIAAVSQKHENLAGEMKEANTALERVNKMIAAQGVYFETKKVYSGLKIAQNPKAYRENNVTEISKHEAARRELKELLQGQKMPSMQELKAEKARLTAERENRQKEYQETRQSLSDLRAINHNLDTMLNVKQETTKETAL